MRARESVRHGVKRIVTEEIECAVKSLTHEDDRDEAIHDARKNVKKIRGTLRMVRFDLGRHFAEENGYFRDVGRKLSELRDAKALLEIYEEIEKRFRDELGPKGLPSIRKGLEERKTRFESATDVPAVIDDVLADLKQASRRLDHWPLHSNGFAAVAPGLEGTFRAGRKAFAAAYADPTPENFHEWRKRAKEHWYHIRLLENLWTPVMQSYESSLKCLEQDLGDDHNIQVLHDAMQQSPELFRNKKEIAVLFRLADTLRAELRAEAQSIGERIYGPKPKEFTAQMQHLWEAWKHENERSWARRTLVGQRPAHPRVPAAKIPVAS